HQYNAGVASRARVCGHSSPKTRAIVARAGIVMYGNVMRERSRLASGAASASGSRGTEYGRRAMKLRFRASHRRATAPLRISHHGSLWQPPVKDADREDPAPARRKKK